MFISLGGRDRADPDAGDPKSVAHRVSGVVRNWAGHLTLCVSGVILLSLK